MHGSSAEAPMSSTIEAEAIALLMATQQMIRLNYSKVAFMGDCKSLFDEFNQFKTEQTIRTSVSQRLPLCYRISLRSQDIEITLFITYLDIILML
ncbi:hypothetical protein HID58_073424 [Brassica napus]|uniref:RNase H type-1 domain-containing protein n=2 Tax=Brassica TaxID=3705 RepID=A0ABQ7Z788_BRANA|nr:hypothetical protein F2Q69_00051739 [Brassica cretica]KAH0876062.1 hypothetical protein HID58_073424 [Brassica napus]